MVRTHGHLAVFVSFVILLSLLCLPVLSRGQSGQGIEESYASLDASARGPCISEEQYAAIRHRVEKNVKRMREEGILPEARPEAVVTFRLPLFAPHVADYGYYYISAYVDHDPDAGEILDWNCGSRTYDGHWGTDFAPYPYGWFKMDHNEVKVAAAAAGIIVDRNDGEFDRCCEWGQTGCETANYIVVEHADGSRTLYWHFKNGSVTSKLVDDSVYKGEYLGVVASSGMSNGPHLHFEVWDSEWNHIDPYSGDCNSLNADNWWDGFQSYYEHGILAISTHSQPPEYPVCPGQETSHKSTLFHPGDPIVFGVYYRDLMSGDITDFEVREPGGAVRWSWIWPSPNDYPKYAYEDPYHTLPSDAPLGDWTFEATYRGVACSRNFEVTEGETWETATIYMESMTAEVDEDGYPAKYCHRAEEQSYQNTSSYGYVLTTRRAIFAADMKAIPENAVIVGVDPHIRAKRVSDTGDAASFAIFANWGRNDHAACEDCMDWYEAFDDCNLDAGPADRLYLDSDPGLGEYINRDLRTLLESDDIEKVKEHAISAHANYNQHNHYLFFYMRMQIGDGPISAVGDGTFYGEAAPTDYRPYIEVEYCIPETAPPSPDPMQWASPPYAPVGGTTSLSMSAVEASDDTPPIEYYFQFTGGGPGGGDRDWDTSREYIDNGLSPNHDYSYKVFTRDSMSPPNEGGASLTASAFTNAEVPPAPLVMNPTGATIDVQPQLGGNPVTTELALWNATDGCWVDAAGANCGSTPMWQTAADWGTVTVTDLLPGTSYCFHVQARNGDSLTVPLGADSCLATQPEWIDVAGPPLNDGGHGKAAAWGDYDGDGDLDLYHSRFTANRLFKNLGGGVFEIVTDCPVVADEGQGRGVAWGDYDNDGDLDLYVSNRTPDFPNRLFRNDADGCFTDVAGTAGVADTCIGEAVAWADYNNDGYLDLYLVIDTGPDRLYRNNAGSTFTDVGPQSGLTDSGHGVGVAWADYDNDGDQDLCLTGSENKLFSNNLIPAGTPTFSPVVCESLNAAQPGQGLAWGDCDNDGDLDLYVARGNGRNKLLINDLIPGGQPVFYDVTSVLLAQPAAARDVSWADYDNDGDLDIYVTNVGGGTERNRLFRNEGGCVFVDVSTDPVFSDENGGNGVAWADYDRNGILDLYLCKWAPNQLFKYVGDSSNYWLQVDLEGVCSNRSAIGARIRMVAGGASQIQEISGGSGYCSQNSLTVEFGLGETDYVDTLYVLWPSGVEQVIAGVDANQVITLVEDCDPAGVGKAQVLPLVCQLHQNSPNPFRGSTVIRYDVSEKLPVSIRIYDVAGRVVCTLEHSLAHRPGQYIVQWNGCNGWGEAVASGIYFCRFEAGSHHDTRRIVFLR